MLDRSTAPLAQPMNKVLFPEVRILHLNNGIPVYTLQVGQEEVTELQILVPGGKSHEQAPGISSFTSQMMSEGTRNYSSLEFARKLDEFGAFINIDGGFESGRANLTTLTRHLGNTIPLLREMVLYPIFPESEFVKLKERHLQRLDVEEQKTTFVARKRFNELLFGKDHPYGRPTEKSDVQALQNQSLVDFHTRQFSPVNFTIVATGRFDEKRLLAQLNEAFGGKDLIDNDRKTQPGDARSEAMAMAGNSGLHYFEKAESMQATVRVGHEGFSRSHADYHRMQVVTTVLGGYFGSRLMKNIREEKGYTYGIGSAWLSWRHNGIFLIQTDVGNEYIEPTLREIEYELSKLMEGGVAEDELRLVKNYMLGRSISSRETPSRLADIITSSITNDIDFSDMDDQFEIIQSITPQEVKELCAKYYDPAKLLKVVCGKMG